MKSTTTITATFNCPLERAFKAPILGDATKFLNGYLFQPPVTGFENDESWGQHNGIRYPISNGNLITPAGILATDKILERKENESWKWQLDQFRPAVLFFTNKAVGEWEVREIAKHQVRVRYTYTYYAKHHILQPLNWLFVKIQVRGMMEKAMKGIRMQAESDGDFVYE